MLNQARQSRYFGPPSSQESIRGGTKNLLLDVSLFSVLYKISSQVEMKGVVCGDLGDLANVMWTHIKPLSSGCSEISRTKLD